MFSLFGLKFVFEYCVKMGIFVVFRWFFIKYFKIIFLVIEDILIIMDDGVVILVDIIKLNFNGEEFDNLYFDMNGIVYFCFYFEDRFVFKDEEEMMVEIFKYMDCVVNMVWLCKFLMIVVGMLNFFFDY